MKRKLLTLFFIVSLMISLLSSNVFGAITSVKCSLNTPKNQYNVGENVVVTFRLDELNADKGIIAYSAVLDYDKEALQYVKSEGAGSWVAPSYNDENGKFIADRNDDYSSMNGEDLCTITFKALKSVNGAKIKLSEITFSNGGKEVGTHSDVEITVDISEEVEPSDTPSIPSNPTNPDNPDTPDTPDNPNSPDTPNTSDNPNTPDTPNISDTPSGQKNPDTQKNPVIPNVSGSSNNNNKNTLTVGSTNKPNNNTVSNSASARTAKGIIPPLGNGSTYFTVLIFIALIVVTTFFIKMKLIDFKIKKNNE